MGDPAMGQGAAPPGAPRGPTSRLRLRVRRVGGPPVVAVRVALRGGLRAEAKPGQALIAGRLLAEGTRQRDWRRIALEAEERGASLAGFGGATAIGVSVDALAVDWQRALDWAAESTLEATFPEDRCAWLTDQATGELRALDDQPDHRTGLRFLRQLYGEHPLGRPPQGDRDALRALAAADCAAFHGHSLAAGAVVTVAGAIDEEAVRRRAERLFAALDGAAEPHAEAPGAASGVPRQELASGGRDQAHLFLGHLTAPRSALDFAALRVLSVVLGAGAGLAGRLPERLRERDGLAYVVSADAVEGAGLDPGRLVVYAAVAEDAAERAEAAVREELQRLLADGVEDREVEEAKAFLSGREAFRRETARQWSDLLLRAELLGLPLEDDGWAAARLAEVTRDGVEAAARRVILPRELRVTVGLPEA